MCLPFHLYFLFVDIIISSSYEFERLFSCIHRYIHFDLNDHFFMNFLSGQFLPLACDDNTRKTQHNYRNFHDDRRYQLFIHSLIMYVFDRIKNISNCFERKKKQTERCEWNTELWRRALERIATSEREKKHENIQRAGKTLKFFIFWFPDFSLKRKTNEADGYYVLCLKVDVCIRKRSTINQNFTFTLKFLSWINSMTVQGENFV